MSSLYPNPNATLPMPAPGGMPGTLWTAPRQRLGWSVSGDSIVSTWRTPVFDLRSDLRSGQGGVKFGVPIWRGGYLYLQFYGLSAANVLDNFNCVSSEFASVVYANVYQAAPNSAVVNPGVPNQTTSNNIVRVTAPIDITSSFMLGINQPDSVVIPFAPLGEGTPVRYWALELNFKKLVVGGFTDPSVSVEAAYY